MNSKKIYFVNLRYVKTNFVSRSPLKVIRTSKLACASPRVPYNSPREYLTIVFFVSLFPQLFWCSALIGVYYVTRFIRRPCWFIHVHSIRKNLIQSVPRIYLRVFDTRRTKRHSWWIGVSEYFGVLNELDKKKKDSDIFIVLLWGIFHPCINRFLVVWLCYVTLLCVDIEFSGPNSVFI